ncbi:MAG: alpha/beta hydrolase [Chloroflexota bacterium]
MLSRKTSSPALLLVAVFAAGCAAPTPVFTPTPVAVASPTTIPTPAPAPTSIFDAYAFPSPEAIDPSQRYLFSLHGRIIEDQGLPAISPEFGEYEYAAILQTLSGYGLRVISEQRPKNADSYPYAQRVVSQIRRLLAAGVPPGQITVLGASKGATIAVMASYLLQNEQVNFVLLATCHPDIVQEWQKGHVSFYGNVLSIYDFADTQYSGSCQPMFELSKGKGLGRHEEIVLQVGSGHGVCYKPLDEWILPTVNWAKGE